MKYAIVAAVCLFVGFVGAWLLFERAATTTRVVTPSPAPLVPVRRDGHGPQPAALPTPSGGPGRVTFEDIRATDAVFDQLYMAWRLAADADVPQVERLIDRALGQNDPLYRDNIVSILLERYVALDPLGAAQFVEGEYRLNQVAMMGHVLTSWVRYDPDAAVEYYRNLSDQRIRISAGARLLLDPTLAGTALRAEVIDVVGERQANRIMERQSMQQADPFDLFESALTMRGSDRRTRLQVAVTRWMEQDPEGALSRLEAMPDSTERERLLSIAVSAFAQADPAAAYDYVQLNHPQNASLFTQAINMIAVRDVQRALPLAEDFQRRFGNLSALTGVLRNWANNDPQAAVQYAQSLPRDQRREVIPSLAWNYVQQEPAAGMRWLLGLDEELAAAASSALQVRSVEAQRVAEQLLPSITNPQLRLQLVNSLAQFRAETQPADALDWVRRFEGETGYAQTVSTVLNRVARDNPERAARFAEANLENPDIAPAISTIAQIWFQRDPDGATEWVMQLPEGAAGQQAVTQLSMLTMNRQGLDEAIALVSRLPRGDARATVSQRLAWQWARSNPGDVERVIDGLDLPPAVAERLRAID